MSFAALAKTIIAAALPDAVVVTVEPATDDGVTFDPDTARMRSVVYLYDGADPASGPWQTSTEPTLYAACYGATQDAALGLARQVREALPARTQVGTYVMRPPSVAAPVQDRGYNPPEWYSLVRWSAIGLYGEN